MTRRIVCALLIGASVFALQVPAQSIGVFFDAAATQRDAVVPSFTVITLYVIGLNIPNVEGWEASITDLTATGWNVVGATLHPETALNLGSSNNFIVGMGSCVQLDSLPFVLVTYPIGWFSSPTPPNDVEVCLGPATPSSFGGEPGYVSCTDNFIVLQLDDSVDPWIEAPPGCGIINCSFCGLVPTEKLSLGALKGRY